MDILIRILEESIKRNGEKPLTNKWLLNILYMARQREEEIAMLEDAEMCRID